VLANPVGLVERAEDWPGATAFHAVTGAGTIVATRPTHFFRDGRSGGDMPTTVTITFEPPPTMTTLPAHEYVRMVRERLAAIETDAATRRQANGAAVLGRKKVVSQHWNDRPGDVEPRRQLSPTLACRDKWRRIERLRTNKLFQTLYRAALDKFRAGAAAIFPLGTWTMRFRAPIQISTA
jgi:putative transposase